MNVIEAVFTFELDVEHDDVRALPVGDRYSMADGVGLPDKEG